VKGSGPDELDSAVSLCTLTFVKDFFFPLHFVTLSFFWMDIWAFGKNKKGKKKEKKSVWKQHLFSFILVFIHYNKRCPCMLSDLTGF